MKLRKHRFLAAVLVSLVASLPCSAQECDPRTGVCDKHERCPVWTAEGECLRNREYMRKHCPVSCNIGGRATTTATPPKDTNDEESNNCTDRHERCGVWAKLGECDANPQDMHKHCPKSCDVCNQRAREATHIEEEQDEFVEDVYDDDENDLFEEEEEICEDTDPRCSSWAKSGECSKNPNYMHRNCAKSCDTCDKAVAADHDMMDNGEMEEVSAYAQNVMDRTQKFGERQQAQGSEKDRILKRLEATLSYMASEEVAKLPVGIRRECKNRHALCTFWQVIGECEKNRAYMTTNCAAACHSCHLIDHAQRCPKDENAIPALMPGDLNQMFERIVSTAPGNRTDLSDEERQTLAETKTPLYTVQVHSRPSKETLTEVSVVQDKSLPPWVITFDNFLTDEECEDMIQLGYKYEYKRSEDVGARKFDGSFDSVQSASRTSENAWCSDKDGCRDEDTPKLLHERMAQIMGIPAENSEDLQLLKYEKGQFYRTHHDYIPHQRDRQCGPRILTFFLYLSDVEAGGGTNFPNLGSLTIDPKRGRALLWPSVLDSDPLAKDSRMNHQALPVEEGIKYAANGWIHLYDYIGPQKRGCN